MEQVAARKPRDSARSQGVDFKRVDLAEANLTRAHLDYAVLCEANLSRAPLCTGSMLSTRAHACCHRNTS
jgi:uncharacterized protein YjbI with pentapeptide repeats